MEAAEQAVCDAWLALEDWFDERLGPDIRRFVFHALRCDREKFDALAASQIPAALRRYRRLARSPT